MPLTNPCNRLVVTSTRTIPHLSIAWLSLSRPPLPLPDPLRRTNVRRLEPGASTEAPASPKASPSSSGDAVGAAPPSCVHHHPCTSVEEGRPPVRGGVNPRAALSALRRPNDVGTDTPCRAASRSDFHRTRSRNRGPFPQTAHQRRRFPDPECLPPMSPVRSALLLALRTKLGGPPLVSRLCRFDPASDARSLARTS